MKESITGGIGEYSFRVQLEAPIVEEKYSLTLYKNDTLITNFTTESFNMSVPGLEYNTRYSLVISTANCFNEENNTTLEISQGRVELLYIIALVELHCNSLFISQLVARLHLLQWMVV